MPSAIPFPSADERRAAPTVLRMPDLTAYLRLSRSTIYQMVADGQMPAPIKLGARASGWLKCEIDAWLLLRIAARTGAVRAA